MKHECESIQELASFRPSRICRSYLPRADGFRLMEHMLAVSIVDVLAARAVQNYMEFIEEARVARAISERQELAKGTAVAAGKSTQVVPAVYPDVIRATDGWFYSLARNF